MADLHFGDEAATAVEAQALSAWAAETGVDGAEDVRSERLVAGGMSRRRDHRHHLLPGLHVLQRASGWISPGGLTELCRLLGVPPADAYGVASFYDLFRTSPPDDGLPPRGDGSPGRAVHWVCSDVACRLGGSQGRTEELAGERVEAAPCLGQCDRPVGVFVQRTGGPDVSLVDEPGPDESVIAQQGEPGLRLLRRVGRIDPTSLDAYVGAGGYRALTAAFERGPKGVIDEVAAAGLTGRGGAAFPTAVKWRAVAAEPGPRHVVVNLDESEPGTFKDRLLAEHDPFAIVEALTIAAFAAGADQGWIYVRGEYPLAAERLRNAIAAAREAGFLGNRIARSSFAFDIEVRVGAGAYICGEETALFNSIEGFRGEPRQKPPFPTTEGLFGRPTAVNNPETLLNVLDVVTDGAQAFRAAGTEGSPGTKLFCLSGHVNRPGVYETPFGVTLGELLQLAGGVSGDLRAVLLGGAAGSFVGPDRVDLPLTMEDTRAVGLSLGSGVVMAFNADTDFVDITTRLAEFFGRESCGQCVPCRIGTQRQHEMLVRTGGRLNVAELRLLDDLDRAMKDASICGLGHTASTAVRSALHLGLIGIPGTTTNLEGDSQ